MNSKFVLLIVVSVICVFAFKNHHKITQVSIPKDEPESVEEIRQEPSPLKAVIQEPVPQQRPEPAVQPPIISDSAKTAAEIPSVANTIPAPRLSMNQKFFERYQKADIAERLQKAKRLEKGD